MEKVVLFLFRFVKMEAQKSPQKVTQVAVKSLSWPLRCVHWMSMSAVFQLLPQT